MITRIAATLISGILLFADMPYAMAEEQSSDEGTKKIQADDRQSATKKEAVAAEDDNLAKIDISGVDDALKKNIELHMPVSIPQCQASKADVNQFFRTLKKHLRRATRALGYYDADFRSGGKIVNNCWQLRLRITPGQPVKVMSSAIRITGEGSQEELFKKILIKPPYQKGDVLNHQAYNDFKTALAEAAQSLGYFDASFERHQISVNPESYQATVDLLLNTGGRYRYGVVNVDQNVLRNKVLQRFLIIKPGRFYSTEDILRQQQLLQRSGYFQSIEIDVAHTEARNSRVPININLVERKRSAYIFKVGYGTDTGGRVSAELDRRWTGSRGRKLKIKTQYSQNLSGISLNLEHPRENPENDSVIYSIDYQNDKNDSVKSRSFDIGALFTRKTEKGWTQTAFTELILDETTESNQAPVKSKYLVFGVGLDKTRADNPLYPDNAWRLKAELKTAFGKVISDQNVLQFNAYGKIVRELGTGKIVGRLTLGATIVDDFRQLPKRLRFFAGGGNSVRGYDFESLGELDSAGDVVGGKNLVAASFEYQHPVIKDWSLAAFVDVGNAFDDWGNYELKYGVGAGIRWRSPIGPVRFDLAAPKDDRSDIHFHLSVGPNL